MHLSVSVCGRAAVLRWKKRFHFQEKNNSKQHSVQRRKWNSSNMFDANCNFVIGVGIFSRGLIRWKMVFLWKSWKEFDVSFWTRCGSVCSMEILEFIKYVARIYLFLRIEWGLKKHSMRYIFWSFVFPIFLASFHTLSLIPLAIYAYNRTVSCPYKIQ